MSWLLRAAAWLRENAEYYLTEASEQEMAAKYRGAGGPVPQSRPGDRFWREFFVPVYRKLPWRMRLLAMRAMPGSHWKRWRGG
ncbi:MAG: hypothetical protein ACR2MA_01285 [Egibacteraceae bacterium]